MHGDIDYFENDEGAIIEFHKANRNGLFTATMSIPTDDGNPLQETLEMDGADIASFIGNLSTALYDHVRFPHREKKLLMEKLDRWAENFTHASTANGFRTLCHRKLLRLDKTPRYRFHSEPTMAADVDCPDCIIGMMQSNRWSRAEDPLEFVSGNATKGVLVKFQTGGESVAYPIMPGNKVESGQPVLLEDGKVRAVKRILIHPTVPDATDGSITSG